MQTGGNGRHEASSLPSSSPSKCYLLAQCPTYRRQLATRVGSFSRLRRGQAKRGWTGSTSWENEGRFISIGPRPNQRLLPATTGRKPSPSIFFGGVVFDFRSTPAGPTAPGNRPFYTPGNPQVIEPGSVSRPLRSGAAAPVVRPAGDLQRLAPGGSQETPT